MNAKEIRAHSTEELKTKLMDTKQEQMNLRFQMVTGQLTDHSRFKVTRRLIARIETILAEREREAKEK